MTNAELILDITKTYDDRTREEILANLNIAIALSKAKGKAVDRYRALPAITERSKHSVMSWFNRDKKIPLIDLCVIAVYLEYNLYAFFDKNGDVAGFLSANDYCNSQYPKDSAEIFIRASKLQYDTDKNIVLDNLEKYYGSSQEIMEHHSNRRQADVMEICGCELQTYYAWFNRSRTNVRVPLIALCKLAASANVDIFDLFKKVSE